MTPLHHFLLQFVWFLIAWGTIATIFVVPRVRDLEVRDALSIWIAPNLFHDQIDENPIADIVVVAAGIRVDVHPHLVEDTGCIEEGDTTLQQLARPLDESGRRENHGSFIFIALQDPGVIHQTVL